MRRTVADPALLRGLEYEELDEIWTWDRVKSFELRGDFAQEVVDAARLREILLFHLDQIEDSLRVQVAQAIQVVKGVDAAPLAGELGRWLLARPQALEHMRRLYERKVAEVGSERERLVAGEMVTQAALNYLNKVFFLSLCEDRHWPASTG